MAGKKKRVLAKAAKSEKCACCAPGSNLMEMLLIILGGIGLLYAIGWINWPGFSDYFKYVWSILVLVIGIVELKSKGDCSC